MAIRFAYGVVTLANKKREPRYKTISQLWLARGDETNLENIYLVNCKTYILF